MTTDIQIRKRGVRARHRAGDFLDAVDRIYDMGGYTDRSYAFLNIAHSMPDEQLTLLIQELYDAQKVARTNGDILVKYSVAPYPPKESND